MAPDDPPARPLLTLLAAAVGALSLLLGGWSGSVLAAHVTATPTEAHEEVPTAVSSLQQHQRARRRVRPPTFAARTPRARTAWSRLTRSRPRSRMRQLVAPPRAPPGQPPIRA